MFTPYITTVLPWELHQTMLTSPHINPVVKPSLREKKNPENVSGGKRYKFQIIDCTQRSEQAEATQK